jgi:serine/threonine protein kinase/WD40 repeat protein
VSDVATRLSNALADRYRVERELGAGGMATVYLAEDLKHHRKVAIKVLRPELAAVIGADRFLREIETIAGLQHPHILGLIDSGEVDGTAYYVMPFVEGESLRDRLNREKQLPVGDAIRIATEVAGALDYAHRHGVIHRDIKPENILLHEGQALVADFGIALAASKAGGERMTETGMSLGTPQYMSPEQAMGEREITARSDIYALGAMTYEMLVGEPPFTGPSAQAIIAKVLTTDPVAPAALRRTVPSHVELAVLTALQKLPADRYGTATQFADALRGSGAGAATSATPAPSRHARSKLGSLAFGLAGIAVGAAAVWGFTRSDAGLENAVFVQRTFGTEAIFTARYTNSGTGIVYSAAARGSTPRLYSLSSDYPEPRQIGDSGTQLLSVSSKNELAVVLRTTYVLHRLFAGTLARMPIGGGAPREILADVRDADWSPDGTELAVVHEMKGRDRLEYPIGTVLYESFGYLSDPRVSPDGKTIAFHEHALRFDDRGTVSVVDLKRSHRVLTGEYWGLEGLAWRPDGKRLLFGGAIKGFYQVHEVSMSGSDRLVLPSAGTVTVQDVAPDGRMLLTRDDMTSRLFVKRAGDAQARDISWLDNSSQPLLSRDGELVAFTDESETIYSTLIRKSDGSPAVRLGDGGPRALSNDKRWVVSNSLVVPQRLTLYPTGAGAARRIDRGELETYMRVQFFPDDKRLFLCGKEPKRAPRCYTRPVSEGTLTPVTPEGVTDGILAPDGRQLVGLSADSGQTLYSLDGSPPRVVRGILPLESVLRFSPDSRALWVSRMRELPIRVERLDLATGARSPVISVMPEHQAGLLMINVASFADDPRSHVYLVNEHLSHVFELKGMR